jgi:hypothetical protein
MIAPGMAACLLIGHAYASLSQSELRSAGQSWREWSWVPLVALLAAVPARKYWALTNHVSAPIQARAWFHENVPSGTPVFVVGRRPESPRLVGTNERLQAKWGGHFNYGRDKYEFLKRAFHKAFSDYAASGKPRYRLDVFRSRPFPRSKRMPRTISDSLFTKAQARGQRYIIVAGFTERNVLDLHYRWFSQAILEQQFGGIAIFRVPEKAKAPSKETVSAAAPSAG